MEQQNTPETQNTREVKKSATRSQKKKSHTGAKAGVTAAVILALLGGGYFGLGGGGQGGLFPNGQSGEGSSAQESAIVTDSKDNTEAESQTAEITEEDDKVLDIVITESGIQYEGKDVSVIELEEALLKDFQDGVTVNLKDDHAIKATYDEVTALLSKLNINFTTGE